VRRSPCALTGYRLWVGYKATIIDNKLFGPALTNGRASQEDDAMTRSMTLQVEPWGREDEVVKAVEEDIIFGRLAPGTRITEDALLARFPVTRHFVRQALVELERRGIVVLERNKGATVRSLTPAEVREIYEVREIVQRQAALAIPLPAPKDLVDRLLEIHAAYSAHVDAGYLPGVHEMNDQFHLTLFGACGNRYLVETIAHYMKLSLPVRAAQHISQHVVDGVATTCADRDKLEASRSQHRIMIDLLKGHDRWALAQLCVDHLQPSKVDYLERIASPV
jgi:DNA-binding GntR family transcriptional regulator